MCKMCDNIVFVDDDLEPIEDSKYDKYGIAIAYNKSQDEYFIINYNGEYCAHENVSNKISYCPYCGKKLGK